VELIPTKLRDVLLHKPRVFGDARGHFLESWNRRAFSEAGLDADFVQDNASLSVRGTLRGLHYQIKNPQGKLVWAVEGEILDVAVDLRRSSPTFGQADAFVLSGSNFLRAWVPPGFAHGFHVLSETANFCYKCTNYYSPADERVIAWNDPDLAIDWQIPPGESPTLSVRDSAGMAFREAPYFD